MELLSPNGDVRIPAPVVITEILSQRTYNGTLPNGKVLLVFDHRDSPPQQRQVGARVTVGLSLSDFSCGEILDAQSQ
jgi:hypothetical protein